MSSILLDTNYLIKALIPNSTEAEQIGSWIERKIDLITSSVCWYEFLCGPVDERAVEVMEMILQERIIPFTADQAQEAAKLYNRTGRKRSRRVDSMIAAAAIISNAALATDNNRDFSVFEELGLTLV
ncbi:MAG: type II toxin-antitoxin system VapC family toxin [Spirochaetia bacterium]